VTARPVRAKTVPKRKIKMPKLKSNRAAKKRFRKTATGKILRRKAFKSHILTKKTTKRKRKLDTAALICDADHRKVQAMLPYGSY
jgi:large subunit ribosomal protein L35